jgi:hypothetical protein
MASLRGLLPSHPCPQLINLRYFNPNRGFKVAALPSTVLETLLFAPPPQCFTAACQEAKDAQFLAALAAPVVLLALGVAWLLRRPPDDADVFEDPATGIMFDAAGGEAPELDTKGELAFRAIGYTPWPVEAGAEGERLRVEVGPVSARQPRTFVFEKSLAQPSELLAVTLPRPLGVVFEEDRRKGRVVVADILPGSYAEQRRRRAALDRGQAAAAAAPGDVLRAITATTLQYPTQSLFGAKPPQRCVVLYGADGKRWPEVATALKRGLVADGEVTMVLERKVEPEGRSPAAASSIFD